MTFSEWINEYTKRKLDVIHKLKDLQFNKTDIIEYFDFSNMVKNEPDFCPLYSINGGTKCHDFDNLNCFYCACPFFQYSDDEPIRGNELSICTIDSKFASKFKSNDNFQCDCSDCLLPHRKSFVKKMYMEYDTTFNFKKDQELKESGDL